MWAVGLEMGEENGGNKDGQSELETGKGGGENGSNGLGAVRIEFGVWGLGLWGCGTVGPGLWGCGDCGTVGLWGFGAWGCCWECHQMSFATP